jgi:phage terminase large subunit-like protein
VFNTAKAMVEQCGDLHRLSKLIPSTKRIIFPHTNSFYRVLSSETKSKQGFNVSGLIFDELFAQQNRELFDTMTKYTGDTRRTAVALEPKAQDKIPVKRLSPL